MTNVALFLNRRTVLTFFGASSASMLASPAIPSVSSGAEQALQAAIEKLRIAMLQGDGVALEATLCDELTYMHSSGHSQTKADLLRDLAGKRFFAGLVNSEVTVNIVGTAGVATMLVDQVKNLSSGRTRASRIKIMQTWARLKGNWKLLARMSAIISSPLTAGSCIKTDTAAA